jgi:hypothetical protein
MMEMEWISQAAIDLNLRDLKPGSAPTVPTEDKLDPREDLTFTCASVP